jgi:hypothetical protein
MGPRNHRHPHRAPHPRAVALSKAPGRCALRLSANFAARLDRKLRLKA